MRTSHLNGTGMLVRFGWRRDRWLVAVWVLVLVGFVYVSAAATPDLYPTEASRVAAAEGWNSTPGIVALYGPIMVPTSLGELSMTKMTVLYAVFVSLFILVLVRRHLRTEEESGRAELVAAAPVGRAAPLAAALLLGAQASLLVGVLATGSLLANGLPVAGSVAFGAMWAGTGVLAAAATAFVSQLSASTRTVGMLVGAVLGVSFLLRVVGDVTDTWVGWVSTFGWNTRLMGWADSPRWWVLLLYPLLAFALVVASVVGQRHRDLGSGLLATRPGRPRGRIGTPLALVARLNQTSFLGWGVAVLVMSALIGAITPNISSLLDSPQAREMLAALGGEGAVRDAMLAAELGIMALLAVCAAVTVRTRLGEDEQTGRSEFLVAAGVSRRRLFAAPLTVGLGTAVVLVLLAGVGMGTGYAVASVTASELGRVVAAASVHLPAVLLTTALVWLLAELWPSKAGWSGWLLVGGFVSLGQFGELLGLPEWVQGVSPFHHTPLVPAASVHPGPLVVMTFLAGVVVAAAGARQGRRDLA